MLQAIVFVPSNEAAYVTFVDISEICSTFKQLSIGLKSTLSVERSPQVLIGTTLEMARHLRNTNTSALKIICFDDAEHSSNFKEVKFVFDEFRNSQFVLAASSVFKSPIPQNFSTTRIHEPSYPPVLMKFANQYNHRILIAINFREKVHMMANTIRCGPAIIFCTVNLFFFK